MGDVAGLLVLVGLGILSVPLLLVAALVSNRGLKRRVGGLEHELSLLRAAQSSAAASVGRSETPSPAPAKPQPLGPALAQAGAAAGATSTAMPQPSATPPPLPPASTMCTVVGYLTPAPPRAAFEEVTT